MYMSRITKQAVSSWDYPVVSVTGGQVRGVAKENGFIFRSIPYASAKRFQPPKAPHFENGLFLADHYTCVCQELLTPIPADQYLSPRFFIPQDEDCLNLNLWTPTLDRQANKPVLVWLGEGDWSRGGVNELFATDGENLSQQEDLVVVAVNHRKNCLGSLDLSAYDRSYSQSGRLCLLDLAAALDWVQKNIAAFGGNPACVTLYGHGAGAQKVFALMQMPELDGMYHRVAVGAAIPEPTTAPADAVLLTQLVMDQCQTKSPEVLTEMPYWFLAEAVLDAMNAYQQQTGRCYTWAPVADGNTFFGIASGDVLRPETAHIPMLLGSSFGEAFSNAYQTTELEVDTALRRAFEIAYPGRPSKDLLCIDRTLRRRILQFAAQQAQMGRPIWNYLFDFNVHIKQELTAWRGAELPFLFENADYFEASFLPEVTQRLQKAMGKSLGAFVSAGCPDNSSVPHWPAVDSKSIPTMIFGKELHCVRDFDRILQQAFDEKKHPERKGLQYE